MESPERPPLARHSPVGDSGTAICTPSWTPNFKGRRTSCSTNPQYPIRLIPSPAQAGLPNTMLVPRSAMPRAFRPTANTNVSTASLISSPRSKNVRRSLELRWSLTQAALARNKISPLCVPMAGTFLCLQRVCCVLKVLNLLALDNGAWSAFTQGLPFDERAFDKAFNLLGEKAEWFVLPDIVAGGMRSLDLSLSWMDKLGPNLPTVSLIAVQDGMKPDDVRHHLGPRCGIFLGGSTSWKLETLHSWGILARRRNCHLHVGRVNSAKRILLCAAAGGAHSIDGTSASMYQKTVAPLSAAVKHGETQQDFLSPNGQDFADTPFDCAWPPHLA